MTQSNQQQSGRRVCPGCGYYIEAKDENCLRCALMATTAGQARPATPSPSANKNTAPARRKAEGSPRNASPPRRTAASPPPAPRPRAVQPDATSLPDAPFLPHQIPDEAYAADEHPDHMAIITIIVVAAVICACIVSFFFLHPPTKTGGPSNPAPSAYQH